MIRDLVQHGFLFDPIALEVVVNVKNENRKVVQVVEVQPGSRIISGMLCLFIGLWIQIRTVKRVASVLSSLVTSCSCGRARTRAWSEAAPDTPEEFPAPPAYPGGAGAAYSAEKHTMSPKARTLISFHASLKCVFTKTCSKSGTTTMIKIKHFLVKTR